MEKPTSNDFPMQYYPPMNRPTPGYAQGPPPPPPPYTRAQMQPPLNVVFTVPVGQTTYVNPLPQAPVIQAPQFGPRPIQMTCTKCGASITTSIKPQKGTFTWLVSGTLCLFGCWLGCCLIPFCVDALRDIDHFCPNCKTRLGTFYRM